MDVYNTKHQKRLDIFFYLRHIDYSKCREKSKNLALIQGPDITTTVISLVDNQ